jgi:hypothetical protein
MADKSVIQSDVVFNLYAFLKLSSSGTPFETCKPQVVTDLDAAFALWQPCCRVTITFPKVNDWQRDLSFSSLADFTEANLAKMVPELAVLHDLQQNLTELSGTLEASAFADRPGWAALKALADANPGGGSGGTIDLLSMVDLGEEEPGGYPQLHAFAKGKKLQGKQSPLVMELKGIQDEIYDQIFKAPQFKELASHWQQLGLLVENLSDQVQLHVVDTIKEDYCDLVFQYFVEENDHHYPQPDFLSFDHAFTLKGGDLEILYHLGRMADYLTCPVTFDVDASVFQLKRWSHLTHFKDISGRLAGPAYIKWRKQRDEPGARWLFPTANPIVLTDHNQAHETQIAAHTCLQMTLLQRLAKGLWPSEPYDFEYEGQELRTASALTQEQGNDLAFEGFSGLRQPASDRLQFDTVNSLSKLTIEPGMEFSREVLAEYSFGYQFFAGWLSRYLQAHPEANPAQIAEIIGGNEATIRIEEDEQRVILVQAPFHSYGIKPEVILGLG